ncbi:aminotransferase class I/II-fold pyridoxal phosphate-dependent enzyme [Bacillus sp. FJAT-49711]|uniref:trans-sulfuration enzyme family protein n=1 Tax=Bacillus sp. FJAT-49711 TaxID=2833585 RepID=UPI001BCA07EC|nr:aminotransferase class I/II-fold pyridoxal phosphate-dependent enzyme [Bacillus sp. FJAT-49711]MBS4217469.1 aminotransferase class I/II-fold pyridoxal phosphate-dependent enzyme [Bacillus sp. FJAT-49711]
MNELKTAENICTHLGDIYEKFNGAVVPPIHENSLFIYKDFESFIEAMKDEQGNYVYSRGMNPTVEIAENKIAALEGGEKCKLFSSGMAAISSALLTFLSSGDHVVCVSNIYGPTKKFLGYLSKFDVQSSLVQSTDLSDIEAAIQPNTKIVYLESPTTMTFNLVDLSAVAKLAKSKGITTIIDNTWSTPIFQKPLQFGIDVVVHSASKYLGGHSDIIGGALITNKDIMKKIFYNEYHLLGGVMPPFEAWLLLRGLRTLPIRMKAHEESAKQIAQFLEKHPAIKKVNYPGLESHPDYQLGKKMLTGYSGLLSFEIKNNKFSDVKNVIDSLKLFNIGVSWGGYESLVLSPNHGHNEDLLAKEGLDPGLIRISVGLESTEELIEDLDQAL